MIDALHHLRNQFILTCLATLALCLTATGGQAQRGARLVIIIDESAASSDTLPFQALRLSPPTAAQQRQALSPEDFVLVAQTDSPNAALLAAQALVDRGRFSAGLTLKSMALEAYPNNRDLHFARMQTAMMAGDPHLAMADALTLMTLGDDNPYVYLTILAALARDERWDDIRRLEAVHLDEPVFNFIVGAVWTIATLDVGTTEQALRRMEQTFSIQGFNDRQQYLLGLASLWLNQPVRANEHFINALSSMGLGSHRAAMWAYRAATLSGSDDIAQDLHAGILRHSEGRYQRYHLAQIELAQNVRPPSKRELMVEMFVQLAWFLAASQDNMTAEILTDMAGLIDGGDQQISAQLALLRSNLAISNDEPHIAAGLWAIAPVSLQNTPLWIDEHLRLLSLLGQHEDTLTALNQAEASDRSFSRASQARLLALRGRTLAQQHRYQEASKVFQLWETVKQDQFLSADWQTYFDWASALFWLDQPDGMEVIIEKALALNPNNPFATNFLAYSWVDQGRRLEQALDMLLQAAEQQPGQASITDSVGWAYFRLGQYDLARDYLERAWMLESNSWEIADHLGDVYEALDRPREAEWFWRRALAFDDLPNRQALRINRKLTQE